MLSWIWFFVFTAISFGLGWWSASLTDKQTDDDGHAEAMTGIAAPACMFIALFLAWPVLGAPVHDWLVAVLPDGDAMLRDFTVIVLLGITTVVLVALPVLTWLVPDIIQHYRKPDSEAQ